MGIQNYDRFSCNNLKTESIKSRFSESYILNQFGEQFVANYIISFYVQWSNRRMNCHQIINLQWTNSVLFIRCEFPKNYNNNNNFHHTHIHATNTTWNFFEHNSIIVVSNACIHRGIRKLSKIYWHISIQKSIRTCVLKQCVCANDLQKAIESRKSKILY